MVELGRFSPDGVTSTSLVRLGGATLDLRPHRETGASTLAEYDLRAVVCVDGLVRRCRRRTPPALTPHPPSQSLRTARFFVFVRHRSTWYRLDGTSSTKAALADVTSAAETPYLLFYAKPGAGDISPAEVRRVEQRPSAAPTTVPPLPEESAERAAQIVQAAATIEALQRQLEEAESVVRSLEARRDRLHGGGEERAQ